MGGASVALAAIALMKLALRDKENRYFHLISGQDWPLLPAQNIYDYFEHTDQIYMDYFKAKDTRKSGEPLIWWAKYYFNYDSFPIKRRSFLGKIYHRALLLFQTIFCVDKLKRLGINEDVIYYGQNWVDVPRNALKYAMNQYDHDEKFQELVKSSFCADEMWLQTILCNSKYKDNINKHIHRYINWEKKNGSYPAILDETDYSAIKKSKDFFGRKFDSSISDKLTWLINND